MKKIIGIVVEYNPFHNGHLYQINKIKEKYKDSLIIVCMSSSFTQRADASILNKWDKTKVALENNVDIVIELPYIYSTQSSDIFASKAVQLLNHLKINTILQARILEWVAVSFSRRYSQFRGLNPCLLCLLHWQVDPLPLIHLGSPTIENAVTNYQ